MEYTEQDAELIIGAIMASTSHVERDTPTLRNQIETTVKLILDGVIIPSSHDPYALDLVSAARLMREAREQGAAERAKYRADDVVLARSPLAASCVRQDVTAQAAANAFEYELHDMTQEFSRYRTTNWQPTIISLATDNLARARADGAEEMRERIVARLRAFGDPDICDAARSVPVTFDESEKEMRAAMLRRQISDAGDRHDWDECNRIGAEIAAVERIDE